MNKTLVIECEPLEIQDLNKDCIDAIKEGRIVLPEKNMTEKLSKYARVIRAANDCVYPYKKNQRICYDQFKDTPVWYEESGKKYRLIKEHYIHWVYEND